MIALISFKDQLIIDKGEAEELGVLLIPDARLGRKVDGGELTVMAGYETYIEDCTVSYAEDKPDTPIYTKPNGNTESTYYLRSKLQEPHNLVVVQQTNQLVDLHEFVLKCKYPFYIERVVRSSEANVDNIQSILHTIEEKATALDKTISALQSNQFNQKAEVHVGGGLITTYNDLMLKEDSCTDVLQTELNNGWRIIAVCVQPDQRRPDYILGRFNPTLDVAEKLDAGR